MDDSVTAFGLGYDGLERLRAADSGQYSQKQRAPRTGDSTHRTQQRRGALLGIRVLSGQRHDGVLRRGSLSAAFDVEQQIHHPRQVPLASQIADGFDCRGTNRFTLMSDLGENIVEVGRGAARREYLD